MKLLFVHDVKAKVYGEKVYARSYGYEIWKERYLPCFDEITVVTRNIKVKEDLIGKVDLLSGESVRYDDRVGMFYGPEVFFNKRVKKIIRNDIALSDYVICRLDSFLGLMAIHECKKNNKPYLVEVAGCVWDSFWNHGFFGKIIAPFLFIQTKEAIKNSKYVVYVTRYFLQSRYPTNGASTNISNVRINSADESSLNERILKYQSFNKTGPIIIGTAANVDVKYKGHKFVIKALARLKKIGYTNFEYQLVGAGSNSYLKRMAEKLGVLNQVSFLGSMQHNDVMKWYKDIDIYIQPSLQEGLPRSVIEAMNNGCFCIGTNIAGIPELIDAEFLIKKRKMVDGICSILLNLDSKKMIEQAKKNFKKAKEYEKSILSMRRKAFFEKFIAENKK